MEKNGKLTPIIFGASGLLGAHLYDYYSQKDSHTIGTYASKETKGLSQFQFSVNTLADLPLLDGQNYIAVICASLTNIGYINAHPIETAKINVDGTISLIQQLHQKKIPILFISSDNVFTGDTGGYKDNSIDLPVSEYGKQKRAVEQALIDITQGECTILRLAKIIGNSRSDNTILNDIIRQISAPEEVKAASDLIFNPTFVGDIVKAINLLIETNAKGIFNFCNPEIFSRLDLVLKLADVFHISCHKIVEIKFSELDNSGKRPLNTTMINSEFFSTFSFTSVEQCIENHINFWSEM
ncbi:sugar nucleotide-binding protein [Pseudoalteromonas xiamenensis]|uniref:dTDP-4-dehydrorhamnose reductase n=1 Tax=Pseudoalteromonas xiamenensis TaxID=882626 RepID=A0A975DFT1_9GAMM|nr:sugar nucleotide-binding protein [Pseudoalteromonas xiamenensis]QTH71038.1 sugar nucleotide-binding protein [Pseudoalteromonas xiamenensis]